jgi:hypothetical protein
VQPATPRYGYNVPEVVEQAGIDEFYIECFDESLKLFSSLQAAGCEDIAPYATLMGHKNRWQFTTTADGLKASSNYESASVKEITTTMREKIAEVHPLIGGFIDQPMQKPKLQRTESTKKEDTPKKPSSRRNRRARRPKK